MDNPRSAGLFAIVMALSAAAAFPLLGLTDAPWSDQAPPAPAPAAPAPAPATPPAATSAASVPTAPAAPKKYRIVWAGGGGSNAGEARAAARPAPSSALVPRMRMSSGSAVTIRPVGNYIATTATSTPARG